MNNKEVARKMYRKGFNTRTISKRLGVSITQVDAWLRDSRKRL